MLVRYRGTSAEGSKAKFVIPATVTKNEAVLDISWKKDTSQFGGAGTPSEDSQRHCTKCIRCSPFGDSLLTLIGFTILRG